MTRSLVPVMTYLPPDAKAEVERRAAGLSIPVATLIRMILLGTQPPLSPAA